jgi:hypothetical protein
MLLFHFWPSIFTILLYTVFSPPMSIYSFVVKLIWNFDSKNPRTFGITSVPLLETLLVQWTIHACALHMSLSCRTEQVGLAVMLCTCIWEVPSLNIGQDTSYPYWGFSWSSLVPSGKWWDSASIRLWPLHSNSIAISPPFIILPFGAM